MRRVWIEIPRLEGGQAGGESPSMRRVWIEIRILSALTRSSMASPSMRRVWIEIQRYILGLWVIAVTLHAEGVD